MKKQLLRWFGILLCWCLFVSCFSVPARASASSTVSISCGDGETVTIDNHSFDSELHSGGLRCQALYNDKPPPRNPLAGVHVDANENFHASDV